MEIPGATLAGRIRADRLLLQDNSLRKWASCASSPRWRTFALEPSQSTTGTRDFRESPLSLSRTKTTRRDCSPRKLYYATGWNTDVIERHYPVYDYFSKVRNCIAHRSGRASNDLVSSASSLPLERCLATWHGSAKKTLPDLPALKVDEDVAVLPRHVILAKEACQRIAKDTNAKLVQFLGVDGMVFLAAYHSLLSDRRLDLGAKMIRKQCSTRFSTAIA